MNSRDNVISMQYAILQGLRQQQLANAYYPIVKASMLLMRFSYGCLAIWHRYFVMRERKIALN